MNKVSALVTLVLAAFSAEVDASVDSNVAHGSTLVFHRIDAGKFWMGEVGSQVPVTISQPFEMSSTETTQLVWDKVVEIAKAKLSGNYYLRESPSYFPSDLRPVESVYYVNITSWIAALNRLSAEVDERDLQGLIPSHRKGDQYRLPTEAEWEFVVRGRGQYQGKYPAGISEGDLNQYAWYRANSRSRTMPVGQREPIMVDGQPFYDLLGNVAEFVSDWYQPTLPGGADPQGPSGGDEKVIRGEGWDGLSGELRSAQRSGCYHSVTSNGYGFRLVRVLR